MMLAPIIKLHTTVIFARSTAITTKRDHRVGDCPIISNTNGTVCTLSVTKFSLVDIFAEILNGCPHECATLSESMSGSLVAHKGFIAKIDIENNDSIIIHKFQVDVKTKQLTESGSFRWTCKTKLDFVTASSVEETLTGRVAPFAVVRFCHEGNNTQNRSYYVVCVDLDKEIITPLRKFIIHLQPVLAFDNKNIHLLDGPSVAVCHNSELHVHFSFKNTLLKRYVCDFSSLKSRPFAIVYSCSCCLNNFKIKAVDLIEHCCLQKKFLLFTVLTVSFKCESHQCRERRIVQTLLFANETFTLVESHQFFPEEYIDCVDTIKLKRIKLIHDTFESEMFIGTSAGYVVHAMNGKMVNCISVFEDSSVQILETGKNCAFQADAILAGKNDAYAILNDKLQIQNVHSGYKFLLTGDFMRNGCEQCLLLEHDDVEQSSWILFDLQRICYSSVDDEKVPETSDVQSGLEATIKALTTKCQLEQISMYDAELRFQQRNDFIMDMLSKQKALLSNNIPQTQSHCQSNMVPLIVSKTADQTSNQVCSMVENIEVNVLGIWQRTYQGKWYIGVDIECRTSRPLTMWVDVVLQEGATNSTSIQSFIEVISSSTHSKDLAESETGVKGLAMCSIAETVAGSSESSAITDALIKQCNENSRGKKSDVSKQSEKSLDKNKTEHRKKFLRTLNCVLSLPTFSCSNILTANVVLNYQLLNDTEELHSKFDVLDKVESIRNMNTDLENAANGSIVTMEHVKRLFTKCCGTVKLDVSDVLEGKFELNFDTNESSEDIFMENIRDSQRDRLAWQCFQYQHHVEVVATPGTLCRFESLLTNECRFLYQDRYDCYVSQNKSLKAVQIQLSQRTRDDRRSLTVYTRSDEDLFLVVHLLYHHLPDCAVILPKAISHNAAQTKCLIALQKEADFLHSGLKELLNDIDSMQASDEFDDENDDIRKVGEKFKQRRENILQKHKEIMENDKIKHFMQQYRKIQHRTDSVVLAMS